MLSFAGAVLAAFIGLMVWCVWSDIGQRRIANLAVVGVAALYPVAFVLGVLPGSLATGLIFAAVVFAVGLAGFAIGAVGGGDVKLAAALCLWAGSSDPIGFALVTVLAGGVLSLLILATRNVPFAQYLSGPLQAGPQTGGRVAAGESVPYGVALAAGGLWIAYGLSAA